LPGGLQYRFTKEIRANSGADVFLAAFALDSRPPDPQFAKNWVPIYCKEGTGYLGLTDLRR
jgi:hypothetical protein